MIFSILISKKCIFFIFLCLLANFHSYHCKNYYNMTYFLISIADKVSFFLIKFWKMCSCLSSLYGRASIAGQTQAGLGPRAGTNGTEPASGFIIQNLQASCSMGIHSFIHFIFILDHY